MAYTSFHLTNTLEAFEKNIAAFGVENQNLGHILSYNVANAEEPGNQEMRPSLKQQERTNHNQGRE